MYCQDTQDSVYCNAIAVLDCHLSVSAAFSNPRVEPTIFILCDVVVQHHPSQIDSWSQQERICVSTHGQHLDMAVFVTLAFKN